MPTGRYELPRRSGDAHFYRLSHPLEEFQRRPITVELHSILAERLGGGWPLAKRQPLRASRSASVLFALPEERNVAAATVRVIEVLSSSPAELPTAALLRRPDVQARITEAVRADAQQLAFEGMSVDVDRVVATVCAEVADAIDVAARHRLTRGARFCSM